MSERRDFMCHLYESPDGVKIGISVSGEKLAFTEITISEPGGEFKRFRVVEDDDNQPLGWRVQDTEKPAPTAADRFINTERLIAQWGSMKERGVVAAAGQFLRQGNRKERRRSASKRPE